MGQSFLEEQLKRIKELTEQISRIRTYRDTYRGREASLPERSSADDEAPRARRPPPRGSSRRRAG